MMRRICLALLLALMFASPAAAHKLKVFAAVEGNTVSGYAFFIGGGRAQDTPWSAQDEAGRALGSGRTSGEGEFRFAVPEPITSDITITVDTQEGHIATRTLKSARFGVTEPATEPAGAETTAQAEPKPSFETPVSPDADTTARIEAAVQRQITPLLERIEEMDARLRFTDVISGIFLIIGLAGIGLWARGRRK